MARAKRKKSSAQGSSSSQFKGGRRPHNVKPPQEISSLDDLVMKVGREPRKVTLNGEIVEMSRAERALRLKVDRALEGKARPVADLLRLMMKYPQISKSYKEETVIVLAGSDLLA